MNESNPSDVVITFNYDMACERELRQSCLWEVGDGYGFSLGLGSLPPSRVKLLKLHGSTNWFGLYFGGKSGFSQFSAVLDLRPTLSSRPDMEFLGYPSEVVDPQSIGIAKSGGFPAMIMPTLHKRFFVPTIVGQREWEPFWDDMWGQAEQALQSSNKIVIIGYSMPVADERARDLLLKHSCPDAEIFVYSGSRTDAICDEFRGLHTAKSSGQGYSWLRIATSKNYHHFFPKDHLAKAGGFSDEQANSILNITLVDDYLNKRKIRAKAPSVYMGEFARKNKKIQETMKTHLIENLDGSGVWNDDYATLIEQCGRGVIKELESRLRPDLT